MNEKNVTAFRVQCVRCDNENKKHETMVYVQWEKRYYMFICYTCGTTEAFDEFGNRVNLNTDKYGISGQ